jgi:hypothetical protein
MISEKKGLDLDFTLGDIITEAEQIDDSTIPLRYIRKEQPRKQYCYCIFYCFGYLFRC